MSLSLRRRMGRLPAVTLQQGLAHVEVHFALEGSTRAVAPSGSPQGLHSLNEISCCVRPSWRGRPINYEAPWPRVIVLRRAGSTFCHCLQTFSEMSDVNADSPYCPNSRHGADAGLHLWPHVGTTLRFPNVGPSGALHHC